MPLEIATFVFVIVILGLFVLDRDSGAHPSKVLWIPVMWLLINASRPVSVWLQVGPTMDSPDQYLDGSPLDALVFGTLVTAGLIVLIWRGRQAGRLLRANAPILLFLFYCLLSTLWSDYSFVAFKRWVKAAGDVVMVLVVLTDLDPSSAIKRLLTRVSFLLVPLSVLFIKYYPDLGRSYNPWTWEPMYSGVTMGKNLLGMTCVVCGLGSLWCFIAAYQGQKGRERTRRLIAHGVILAMVLWLFWMANSMTSFSCLIIAGGVMIMTSLARFAGRIGVVHVLVVTVVCISLFALFLDPGGSLVQSLGRDPTLTGRTAIWGVTLSLVRSPLLGTGFESFWLGNRLQKVWDGLNENGIQEAHNGYLEVYLNLGWVGVTLLAVLIVAGYRNVIATLRRNPGLGRISLAFFVAGMVYSFTEAGFRMMSPVWISFLLAAMAVPESAPWEEAPTVAVDRASTFDQPNKLADCPMSSHVGSPFETV